MKIFILLPLLALSCGKVTEPKAKDLADDDGDGKENRRDQNKSIADLPDLGLIKGKMKIHFTPKTVEVEISNKLNLEKNVLDLVTKGNLVSFSQKQQLDWANLSFPKVEYPVLDQENYKLDFSFGVTRNPPSQLCYEDSEGRKVLKSWSNFMDIELTRRQLEKVLTGYGKLTLSRLKENNRNQMSTAEMEENLRKTTYEVYYLEGKNSRIMNVSKKIPFNRLLKKLNAEEAASIDKMNLFFASTTDDEAWWYRKLNSRTFVLVKTSLQKLQDNFLTGFTRSNNSLIRQNGHGASLKNSPLTQEHAFHFYRIRAHRSLRTFKVRKETKIYGSGGGREGDGHRWKCDHTWRDIRRVPAPEVSYQFLNENLLLQIDKKNVALGAIDLKVEEKEDSRGIYWDIGFQSPGQEVSLTLKSLPAATYFKTGLLNVKCTNGGWSQEEIDIRDSNQEEELSLKIESFVEKKD